MHSDTITWDWGTRDKKILENSIALEQKFYEDNASVSAREAASKLVGSYLGLMFKNREAQYDEWFHLNAVQR